MTCDQWDKVRNYAMQKPQWLNAMHEYVENCWFFWLELFCEKGYGQLWMTALCFMRPAQSLFLLPPSLTHSLSRELLPGSHQDLSANWYYFKRIAINVFFFKSKLIKMWVLMYTPVINAKKSFNVFVFYFLFPLFSGNFRYLATVSLRMVFPRHCGRELISRACPL